MACLFEQCVSGAEKAWWLPIKVPDVAGDALPEKQGCVYSMVIPAHALVK